MASPIAVGFVMAFQRTGNKKERPCEPLPHKFTPGSWPCQRGMRAESKCGAAGTTASESRLQLGRILE
jgi:hypothetical protein